MSLNRWTIAPEYDADALHRLGTALKNLGFSLGSKWNDGLGDISHWEVDSPDGRVVIESETYIGLWIEGPASLIQRIKSEYEAT